MDGNVLVFWGFIKWNLSSFFMWKMSSRLQRGEWFLPPDSSGGRELRAAAVVLVVFCLTLGLLLLIGLQWSDYSCLCLTLGFCWCRCLDRYVHDEITSCCIIALWSLEISGVNFQSRACDGTLHHLLRKYCLWTTDEQWLMLCWEDAGFCVFFQRRRPLFPFRPW